MSAAHSVGLIGALALAGLITASAAQADPVRSIASINLCTDQMLLDLAEPGHIAGLSPYVGDPARSWGARRTGPHRILSGTAEEILFLKPDLVLTERFTRASTRRMIRDHGIALLELDTASTVAAVRQQIVDVGTRIGARDRAEMRVRALDAAVARLQAAASTAGLRVLPLARRGWAAGPDSLLSDLLRLGGLRNAAQDLNVTFGGFVSIEQIVALRPDVIVTTRDGGRAEDQGRALLLHPALTALFPPERRLILPERLTTCGGPAIVEAIDEMTRQVTALATRGLVPR